MKSSENLKRIYEENLDEYQKLRDKSSYEYNNYMDIVINWKIKYLYSVIPQNILINSILEVGCAVGDLIKNFPLSTPLNSRIGLDISTNNILEASKRYPEIKFHDILFEKYAQNIKGKKDLIILSDILEHVPNDVEMLTIAGNMGNYVLLNLPLEKCYEFRNRKYGPNDYRGHLRSYNLNDAKKLIKKAGLKEVNGVVKRYVKSPVFRRYLWNKLVKKKRFPFNIVGSIKYIFELIEISFRYKNYKSNYFVLLKK